MGQATPPLPPSEGCQVRCAGCKMILTVARGLTEFVCPTCQLPQMLPPELMPQSQSQSQSQSQQRSSAFAHGIDPTKIQLPCAHCKAILNVPHGLSRFSCPQCGIDLAVDVSKIRQFLPHSSAPPPPLPLPPPPQEEVNEVFYFMKYCLSLPVFL